jgi:hypothetical protein
MLFEVFILRAFSYLLGSSESGAYPNLFASKWDKDPLELQFINLIDENGNLNIINLNFNGSKIHPSPLYAFPGIGDERILM